MGRELLLDTGALLALLDRSQADHQRFARWFQGWHGPVVSTEAVLTEAAHLLRPAAGGARACLDFFLAGGAVLVPLSLRTLRRACSLIETYADLPMDYTDATLVTLAEELGTDLVFTTDHRDFAVYRPAPGRRFQVLPA